MNSVVLAGKLAKDFTVNVAGGKKILKGSLIIDKKIGKELKEKWKNEGKSTANFPRFEIWCSEAQADLLTAHVAKGDKLMVDGFYQTGDYMDKNGKKVYTQVVNAQDFEFDFKEQKDDDDFEV
jgi:single-stranded DNA-binding protein